MALTLIGGVPDVDVLNVKVQIYNTTHLRDSRLKLHLHRHRHPIPFITTNLPLDK